MSTSVNTSTLAAQLSAAASKRATQRPQRRVVITGTGAISPAGIGVPALWDAARSGRCCITPLPDRFEGFPAKVGGQIPGFDPLEHFSKKEARRFARFVQLAIVAADEALAQSGICLEDEDLTRFACCFGSGIGGLEVFEREVGRLVEGGPKKVSPLFIPAMISNMAAGDLAIRYGLRGECTNIVTACATGTHCVGEAFRLVRAGYADVALCGGTEEGLSNMALAGFGNLGALTKASDPLRASRPFDAERSGFVAGEGAGALILERLEHAQARGAAIIAEVTGFGSTGDGYHMTAPEPSGEGAARAMRMALDEAGFTPAQLGHVNAHGTSTHANDAMEAAALRRLAGDELSARIPVTSVKGCTGHLLGGAGAIEAIVCALSVADSCVPPTAGFATPDPEAPANVSAQLREDLPQLVALSNSFGFGGHNASLALSPYLG